MKIEFQDRTWQLDEADITNKQAEKIRAHTGLSVQKWLRSLNDTDALAWESSFDALYWLMLQQNPDAAAALGLSGVLISDVDYPVYRFMEAYGTAFAAEHPEALKEAEPDPTRRSAASARSPGPASPRSSGRGGGVKPDG